MTVLVVGATGQVGRHLGRLLPAAQLWSRTDADLARPDTLLPAILAAAPSAIVNVAAYTAVDGAEGEAELAWRINAESPAGMARAASALDVPLIHVSTDYVFDGASERGYKENDGMGPINVYGRTKLGGELAVQSLCARHWILRTSWVFSEFGSNFVKTMLRLAGEREPLRVVDDQRGRPGYAGSLAELIAALVAIAPETHAPSPGVYHTGGGPEVSWYDFAREILSRARAMELIPRMPDIEPIPSSEYPTPARRPQNSTLTPNGAFQSSLGVAPDWRAGLDTVLIHLSHQREQSS